MEQEFSLNVNKIEVKAEPVRIDGNEDVYDLRRQIEGRQAVRDYIRTERDRLLKLDQQLVLDITNLDLRIRNRKPTGEPNNKRYLYKPGTEGQYQLSDGEGGAIEGEVVE